MIWFLKLFLFSGDILNMGMSKQLTTSLSFALTMLLSFSTLASSMYTTYQAKIIKPDGTPLESTSVNFRFTILDPLGACILYTENFNTINMAGSGGLVYFSLGSGIKTFPASGTVSFSDVFNNQNGALSCEVGGPASYTPTANDLRKIVMQFHDGTGWQTLPAMAINHVPYAMYARSAASATTAVNSTQLNGKTDLDFVQVTSIPTCTASQALQFNGASFNCVAVGSGNGGTVASVSGTAPITISGSASAPVISISVASTTSDGYLMAADYSEFKAKLSASSTEITNILGFAPVSSSVVAAQIASAGTSSNTPDTLVKRDSSGNFTANDIFANATKTNYVDIYKPSTSFNIRLQAPTSLSANYTLILPDNDGVGGQFLTTDGGGNLSWTSQTTTAISSGDVITALGYTPANSATVSTLQSNLSAVSATANNALVKSNNLSDLTNAATARANLSLGSFATANSIDLGSASATGTISDARLLNQSGVTSGSQYTKITVDGKGRVTSGAQLSASDVTTALGYTPQASGVISSQWNTSGTTINYLLGNVGIGTPNPGTNLTVQANTTPVISVVNNNNGSNQANGSEVGRLSFYPRYNGGVSDGAYISSNYTGIGTDRKADLRFYTTGSASSALTVAEYGWVGIGMNAPNAELDVAGQVIADQYLTSSGMGDFAGGRYNFNAGDLELVTSYSTKRMVIKASTGNVGIGTPAPATKLSVSGGLQISMESATCAVSYAGTLRYNAGNVQFCNGTTWSSFGVAGSGIAAFNGSTSGTQSFANGTAGTAPAFATANGVHTLNIPLASTGSVTAGLISNSDYATFMNKVNATSSAVVAALGYTPANSATIVSSQWNTSGTTINYAAGNVGIGTTAPEFKLSIDNDGGLMAKGSFGVGATLGTAGGGTRMFWYPRKAAFRAGYADTNEWDDINVGNYSAAFGYATKASAWGTFAAGEGNVASNDYAVAMGFWNTAAGYNSMALGETNQALNSYAMTFGTDGIASGAYSMTLGHDVTAESYAQITLGRHNLPKGGESANSWVSTDPLFVVGNGTGAGVSRSTALMILKNGKVGIGTTNPATKLSVSGGVQISMESATCAASYAGTLRYNAGNVQFCNGTTWSSFGVAGSGITTFNGSTSGTQSLANGFTGTTPAFVTANGVHTLNIPLAASASVTAGLISNADYTTLMNKVSMTTLSNYLVKSNNLSDLTSSATARTNLGLGSFATASTIDLSTASATGILSVARLPSFAGDVVSVSGSNSLTVDGLQGRSVVSTAPTSGQVLAYNGSAWAPFSLTATGDFMKDGSVAMTGVFKASDGTAAAPSIAFASDTNTGFYKDYADSFAMVANGSIMFSFGYGSMISTATNGAKINTAAGTAANPVYTFNGVHNSGMFAPGGQVLAFSTSSTERIRIDSSGNVGIGTSGPSHKLDVYAPSTVSLPIAGFYSTSNSNKGLDIWGFNDAGFIRASTGNSIYIQSNGGANTESFAGIITDHSVRISTNGVERMRFDSAGNVGIGTTIPSESLEVVGGIKATSFITSSDRRLKENIQTARGLDLVLNLRGVSYNWKRDGKKEYGLIAQEVEQILPELVVTDQSSGMKGVRYQSLVSPLIEATKELYFRCEGQKKLVDKELDSLKKKNERLEEQVVELKEKLEEIEKYLKMSAKKKRATASE